LAFLEEDDPFATEPAERRLGPPDRERQVRLRRLIAVVVGVLLVVLIVLGVRSCLEARQERQFENYVRDLNSLTSESQQLSEGFFARLDDPENLSELNFEAEVKADRGAAEGLVSRAQNLDAPGELSAAQADVVLAFELRRDGLAAISDQIGTALGDEGSEEATAAIAEDMQYFVAGDVLYRRAQAQINAVLAEQEIRGEAPASVFLPEIDWLDESTVAEALAQITGESVAGGGGGIHGLGLVTTGGVIAQPGDVALTADTPVTVSGLESLDVQVENQGDSEESDIEVTVEADGDEVGTGTIDSVAAGEIATAEIPLDPAPAPGDTVDLEVFVAPVPGEEVADNNEATFPVTVE
jgi:CARDB protein